MKKDTLTSIIDSISVSQNALLKNKSRQFISDFFYDVMLNIDINKERPDFDNAMYSYTEPKFKIIKTFECQATPTMSLVFNAVLRWKYDYLMEEYSELEVTEIIAPRIKWLGMEFNLDEWMSPWEVRKAIMTSANGIAVENWELINGVPQP